MTEVNKEQLSTRLHALNASQQSIEGTANWCLFFSSGARSVVAVWDDELVRAPASQRMSYLYLANHILQEGKKKGREFADAFATCIAKAIREVLRGSDDKTRKSMERLINVWDDRRVFGSQLIKILKDTMTKAKPAPTARPGADATISNSHPHKALEGISDSVSEAAAAGERSSTQLAKVMQLKPNIVKDGNVTEVGVAKNILTNCVAVLQAEVRARQRAAHDLRQGAMKQDEAVRHTQSQLDLMEAQRKMCEDRSKVLAEAQAVAVAAAAAAAQAAAAQAAAQAAAGLHMGMPGQHMLNGAGSGQLQGNMGMGGMGMGPNGFSAGGLPGQMMAPLLPPDQMMAAMQVHIARGMTPEGALAALAQGIMPDTHTLAHGNIAPPPMVQMSPPGPPPLGPQQVHMQSHLPPHLQPSQQQAQQQTQQQQQMGHDMHLPPHMQASLAQGPGMQMGGGGQAAGSDEHGPGGGAEQHRNLQHLDPQTAAMFAQALAALPEEAKQRLAAGMAAAVSQGGEQGMHLSAQHGGDDLLQDEDFKQFILGGNGTDQGGASGGGSPIAPSVSMGVDEEEYNPEDEL